ncbi:hypothetical protein [Acidianus sp. RZ1]|uniref:hypothetical protein n=1 Tax=Acidianus sp. RZ1 TaxID=1540082 RepID=UPI0014928FAA|nr:hypothetical protein [Acidianus sp. RZ1]NON63184.1 hypothetical protein [Acidianus sp. RZ1]
MKSKKIIIALVFLAALIPVVTADVIYYYSGSISVSTVSSPLTLSVGPNGNAKGYITTTVSPGNSSFTTSISITNSSYAYFYQFLEITVSSSSGVSIFASSISYTSTANAIDNAYLVIYSSSGTYVTTIQLVNNGMPSTGTTTPIALSAGKYYASLLVQPSTPLPKPSPTSIATISVDLGTNVVSPATPVPLPPTSEILPIPLPPL